MCKSKIHRARITQAELYYEGSLTIDSDLLDAADILPYERVQFAISTTVKDLKPIPYRVRGEAVLYA